MSTLPWIFQTTPIHSLLFYKQIHPNLTPLYLHVTYVRYNSHCTSIKNNSHNHNHNNITNGNNNDIIVALVWHWCATVVTLIITISPLI